MGISVDVNILELGLQLKAAYGRIESVNYVTTRFEKQTDFTIAIYTNQQNAAQNTGAALFRKKFTISAESFDTVMQANPATSVYTLLKQIHYKEADAVIDFTQAVDVMTNLPPAAHDLDNIPGGIPAPKQPE